MSPQQLEGGVLDSRSDIWAFDVAAYGNSAIAFKKQAEPRIIVVQNWFEELERLVPVD